MIDCSVVTARSASNCRCCATVLACDAASVDLADVEALLVTVVDAAVAVGSEALWLVVEDAEDCDEGAADNCAGCAAAAELDPLLLADAEPAFDGVEVDAGAGCDAPAGAGEDVSDEVELGGGALEPLDDGLALELLAEGCEAAGELDALLEDDELALDDDAGAGWDGPADAGEYVSDELELELEGGVLEPPDEEFVLELLEDELVSDDEELVPDEGVVLLGDDGPDDDVPDPLFWFEFDAPEDG